MPREGLRRWANKAVSWKIRYQKGLRTAVVKEAK